MESYEQLVANESYENIIEAVLNFFYKKYDHKWVDMLLDEFNYIYRTVYLRADEVLEKMLGKNFEQKFVDEVWTMIKKEVDSDCNERYLDDFEQKVADAVWAMIEKEVDGDYKKYLNAIRAKKMMFTYLKDLPVELQNLFQEAFYSVCPKELEEYDEEHSPYRAMSYDKPIKVVPTMKDYVEVLGMAYFFECEEQMNDEIFDHKRSWVDCDPD